MKKVLIILICLLLNNFLFSCVNEEIKENKEDIQITTNEEFVTKESSQIKNKNTTKEVMTEIKEKNTIQPTVESSEDTTVKSTIESTEITTELSDSTEKPDKLKKELDFNYLNKIFLENENVFLNASSNLYSNFSDFTQFYCEDNIYYIAFPNGKKSKLNKSKLTNDIQDDIKECLDVMCESVNTKSVICYIITRKISNKKVVEFCFRDNINYIDYEIIYTENKLKETKLKDNWYIAIYPLI